MLMPAALVTTPACTERHGAVPSALERLSSCFAGFARVPSAPNMPVKYASLPWALGSRGTNHSDSSLLRCNNVRVDLGRLLRGHAQVTLRVWRDMQARIFKSVFWDARL